MSDPLPLAALYPESTRLVLAFVFLVLFAVVVPRPAPRPLSVAVLGVIAAGWLFGATLIWATGGPSKLRVDVELTAWEQAVLLAVAVAGVLGAGIALRRFAQRRRRQGWTFTGLFASAFAVWSAIVRYPPLVAVLVLALGVAALAFASVEPRRPKASRAEEVSKRAAARGPAAALSVAAPVMPVLSGFAFYWWLQWSPKTWIDPACGLPDWLLPTFIPFLAIPGLTAWIRTRVTGKSREASAAAAVIAIGVTVGACLLAFLVWFGAHNCGE